MSLLDGFFVAVVLQLWQEFVPEATRVILGMTALRVVAPMALTTAAVSAIKGLEARWHSA